MKRIFSKIVLCFMAVVFTGLQLCVRADEAKENPATTAVTSSRNFNTDRALAMALGKANNSTELQKFVDHVLPYWKKHDHLIYLYLSQEVCKQTLEANFPGIDGQSLREKLVFEALNTVQESQHIEEQGQLLLFMGMPDRSGLTDKQWQDSRSKQFWLWVRITNNIERKIDKNYNPDDPKNYPAINPMPPTVDGESEEFAVSGMSPQAIKNPKVRKAYEAALEQNALKAKKQSEQSALHYMKELLVPRFARRVTLLYSQKPYNLNELKKHLRKSTLDAEWKKKIFESVEYNMALPTAKVSYPSPANPQQKLPQ